jgi:hypothetical protein
MVDGFPPVQENVPQDVERDNNAKMSFKKNFDNQLQSQQKGDLLGSLVMTYSNKSGAVA